MTKGKKTDSSYLDYKVKLRLDNLPPKKNFMVLDCFCGNGIIWNRIAEQKPDIKFQVLSIDKKPVTEQLHLIGDKVKFLQSVDIGRFDAIDLDAYGSPHKQLTWLLQGDRLKKGTIIYVTFIQSVYGALPHSFLHDLGYSKKMVQKIPTLFYRHGQTKLLVWLWLKGIRNVKYYTDPARKKTYLCFQIGAELCVNTEI